MTQIFYFKLVTILSAQNMDSFGPNKLLSDFPVVSSPGLDAFQGVSGSHDVLKIKWFKFTSISQHFGDQMLRSRMIKKCGI